ncbi:elongation factor Ts [Propionibacterium freudenreichii]|uniref:translation elongation factor Ts n=1 Tax=Propionibacterium freudenreichii TaxID=1744 RepID=UPI000BC33D7C|nr:translation elongation factor Ts [Propionibacterium freudenreichii]MDK9346848.1 elongation factor Ts [Propionibacterium freudenreichii]SBM42995.1 Translation elongation factor Ts [Propionibacterium freudenreichii]
MAIKATDVKKLRDATGAGMMDAKKALTEAEGDFEKATELLRVSGAAKAAKRSDREAANGLVAAAGNALIQLASETDFVAKNAEFIALGDQIAKAVDEAAAASLDEALAITLPDGRTIQQAVADMAAKIGEKIELAHAAYVPGTIDVYLHRRDPDLPPQVGVIVAVEGDDEDFVHSVALQIASMNPSYLSPGDVPADIVERERRIAEETAQEEGKPEKIIPRIVEGRLKSFYKEECLLEQPEINDEKKTVGQLAKEHGVKILAFERFATGA